MRCMDPQLAWFDAKGNKIFRNFSFVDPQFFPKRLNLLTCCRKCLHCRKKQSFELANRCVLHASLYKHNMFLTLTYDESKSDYHNKLQYEDIQKFKKKLRNEARASYSQIEGRKLKYYYFKKIEVFNVHEYGKNGKKHWHLIVFNHQFEDLKLFTTRNNIPVFKSERLSKLWGKGITEVGSVTEASAMYQAQYMEKDFKHNYAASNKKSHSKHSGLGRPYFLKHFNQLLLLGYIPINGSRMPIPRYFERIAERHYSHFYEPSNFIKGSNKEAKFRPFKKEQPNKQIADLWPGYRKQRDEKIKDLEKEWDDVISRYISTSESPDFVKAGENALYDLKRKSQKEAF